MADFSDYEDEHLESPHPMQGGVGMVGNLSDDHKRHARAQHNALERRRRDNIKDMYTSLKDAVPDMQNERASRAVILRRAIESIEAKQRQRAELQADCERIRKETVELEKEIRKIKDALASTIESSRVAMNTCSAQPLRPAEVKVEPEAKGGDIR
ncbi:Helix-loop-helix DNA-binding domain [Parelaphostrongylus tenuis]|uniref:Helix-loop-helix DNA-binding domain n=1 Tax=Parelaphostrongylus tenuis TaxID=148309 RepID=A0AAD5WEH1_PARTN|nr:Helix-loop-helix DNA-binding domain [Parelaphostrongylus tenuis]